MTASKAPIVIKVFRPLDGIRTPYILELDAARNVLSFEVDHAELGRIKANAALLARHQTAAPLLYTHITDEGVLLSAEPLDGWGALFEVWQDTTQPNPFPGTCGIREEWAADLKETRQKIENGDCPSCDMMRLKVSYRVKIKEHQLSNL